MFDANLLLSGRQFWRRQSWKNPRLEYMEIYISAAGDSSRRNRISHGGGVKIE